MILFPQIITPHFVNHTTSILCLQNPHCGLRSNTVNGNQCPRLDVSSNQFVKAVVQTVGALAVVVVRHKSQRIYTAFVCVSVIYSHASHVLPAFTEKICEGQMGRGENILIFIHSFISYQAAFSSTYENSEESIHISPTSLNFCN